MNCRATSGAQYLSCSPDRIEPSGLTEQAAPLALVGLRAELLLGLPGPHSRVCSLLPRKLGSRPRRLGDSSLASATAAGGKVASPQDLQVGTAAQWPSASAGTRTDREAHVQHLSGSPSSKALLSPPERHRNSISQKSSRATASRDRRARTYLLPAVWRRCSESNGCLQPCSYLLACPHSL